MTRTVTDRPTDAEMIQTACRRVSDAILAVEGAESTGTDTGAIDPIAVNVVHLFESQAFVLVPTGGDAMAAVVDAPDPDVGELFEVVYAEPTPLMATQRAQLLAEMAKEN